MEQVEPVFRPPPEPKPHHAILWNRLLFSSVLLLLIGALAGPCDAGPSQPARPPLLSGQPFIIFWGIRDSSCSSRIDLSSFGMERDGRVAVFYEGALGNYPYFVDKNTPVNGGLPQHTRLDSHIQKTQQDLEAALPAPRYLGLGVLRWTEWVPQWSRNREKQAMYREASRNLMKTFFPRWTPEELEKWSRVDFEAAAQSVMVETLREVKRSRPKALWGFSTYPTCFNRDPTLTQLANYTGQCNPAETALNDELAWLWKRSTALYPLLTLEKLQSGTPTARLCSSGQLKEALRVASQPRAEFDLPVFPLVKTVYLSTRTFLSPADLVNTIGESAAMGGAGVIIWDKSETKTERECQDLAEFVRKVLGPYSLNVTTATQLCSSSLCQGKGRCVRQDPDSSSYLHLPPQSTTEEKVAEKMDAAEATDQPDVGSKTSEPDPAEVWKKDFTCQWYKNADRDVSDRQPLKDGAPFGGNTEDVTETTDSATKSASETTFAESDSPVDRSPTTSLDLQSDSGADPLRAPGVHLLLLVAVSFYLGPSTEN
nr:glyco_hydro_56 domain-containing protein [Nothobranchius furzeri]